MKVNRVLASVILTVMAVGAMSQEIDASKLPQESNPAVQTRASEDKTGPTGNVTMQDPNVVAEAHARPAKRVKRSDWYHAYNRHQVPAPAQAASAA